MQRVPVTERPDLAQAAADHGFEFKAAGGDHIVQAFHPLPGIDGNHPLVGLWLVASQTVGLCIREDQTLITGKDASFVPHVILD